MEHLAELILISRRRVRMSQEELASAVGANRASVSLWERGARVPSLGNFATLSKVFEWDAPVVFEALKTLGSGQ